MYWVQTAKNIRIYYLQHIIVVIDTPYTFTKVHRVTDEVNELRIIGIQKISLTFMVLTFDFSQDENFLIQKICTDRQVVCSGT